MDLRKTDNCLYRHIRRTSRRLSVRFSDAMKPAGLTGTQFGVLVTIAENRHKSISQLSSLLQLERTATTRALQPLIERGLVSSVRAEVGNIKWIDLTEEGLTVLEEAFRLWETCHENIASDLDDEERRVLLKLLARLG
jgi:DNA-binding MarR family transcriptional regulator